MKDKELIQQILNGNSNAFRFLVLKYQQLVLHIVCKIIKQQEDIEDICQEVFLKVYKQLNKFRGESKLATWIATIAYNTSISYVQKKQKHVDLSYDDKPVLISDKEEYIYGSFEKEDAKAYLLRLIEQLPVHYRTVLTLYHLEEFSYKEIEEITGMPEGTVKSYLSRARNLLKQRIEKFAENEKTNIFVNDVK